MKVLFLDFLLIVVGMSDTPDIKKKGKECLIYKYPSIKTCYKLIKSCI